MFYTKICFQLCLSLQCSVNLTTYIYVLLINGEYDFKPEAVKGVPVESDKDQSNK